MKLYVGNLSFVCTDSQLRELFESEGFPVRSVTIITERQTQKPKGFAFVQLDRDPQDLGYVVRQFNGKSFLGRTLTVQEPNEPERMDGRSRPAVRRSW